ncbi:hypothetical protein BSY18_4110 (plasmid) [Blastomonas sp. RAC04]|nr:hypothetical protein BSY18_4110 [Blastomonas sp. RAC04]
MDSIDGAFYLSILDRWPEAHTGEFLSMAGALSAEFPRCLAVNRQCAMAGHGVVTNRTQVSPCPFHSIAQRRGTLASAKTSPLPMLISWQASRPWPLAFDACFIILPASAMNARPSSCWRMACPLNRQFSTSPIWPRWPDHRKDYPYVYRSRCSRSSQR